MSNLTKTTKNFQPRARYFARRLGLQALYQWQLADTPIATLEAEFLTDANIEKADKSYFIEILRGVIQGQIQLDEQIKPFLDRPLNSLNPIELSVLRIATYELAHRFDVPCRVVLNEALELNKQFGTIEGYKFINGVLDKVAKILRTDELKTNG
jgi:transcription antitermination protein NusB